MTYPNTAGQAVSIGLQAAPSQPSAMLEFCSRHADIVGEYSRIAESLEALVDKVRGAHPREAARKDGPQAGSGGIIGQLAQLHESLTNSFRRIRNSVDELHQII